MRELPFHPSTTQATRSKRAAAKQERLARIQRAASIARFREFLRKHFPDARGMYAGTLGQGGDPNLEAEMKDGTRIPFSGRMLKDGTFRRRTDLSCYNPKHLVFVGHVHDDAQTAA